MIIHITIKTTPTTTKCWAAAPAILAPRPHKQHQMKNFGLIHFDYCKTHLEMDDRDKELTELLIFSVSAEVEIYTDRNLFEREIRELHDGYLQKEIMLHQETHFLTLRVKDMQGAQRSGFPGRNPGMA